jgi:hypothetical protein
MVRLLTGLELLYSGDPKTEHQKHWNTGKINFQFLNGYSHSKPDKNVQYYNVFHKPGPLQTKENT